jgi:uncharacterized protein with FMN-binding domain
MKRALVVGTGTVMGVAAVLALNPDGGASAAGKIPTVKPATSGSTTVNPASNSSNSSGNAASTPNSSGSNSSGSNSSSSSSKTVTGSAVDVGYGIVQVQAVIKGGKLTDVQAVSLPNNDGHSARISEQAFPMLVQQAIAAQSANISGIGGASYTSYGFQQSLSSALSKAGFTG